MYWEDYLPVFMFLGLAFGLFSGIPVAFVVGGVGLLFGFIGMFFDMFAFQEFFNIPVRIWGGAVENSGAGGGAVLHLYGHDAGALRRRPGFAGNP